MFYTEKGPPVFCVAPKKYLDNSQSPDFYWNLQIFGLPTPDFQCFNVERSVLIAHTWNHRLSNHPDFVGITPILLKNPETRQIGLGKIRISTRVVIILVNFLAGGYLGQVNPLIL